MKISNFALSLSIVSAVVLFLALVLYSGSSNIGSMRTQIGTDISAVNIPEPINSLAINRVQTINSVAIKFKPTINSLAKVRPTINSAETLLTYAY